MRDTLANGRYRIGERLGEGGSGDVFRADDTVLGVPRAVKCLAPALARDAESCARFRREAMLMARLRHPNVAAVHDLGEADGRPFLVMDLLPGGSLADRMRAGGPLPPGEAADIVLGVLDALASVHAEGIVHRDVKPANVLFDSRGVPCLADFGIARAPEPAEHPTRTGSRLGTFAYMAPEQLDDPRSVDARADLHACGALLCALLVGDDPFGLGDSERRAALLSRLPVEVRPVVDRATQTRPEARFPDAAAMARALREAVRLPAPPRRQAWWMAGGAVVFAAGALVAWAFEPDRREEPAVVSAAAVAEPSPPLPPELPVVETPAAEEPPPRRKVVAPPAAEVAAEPPAPAPTGTLTANSLPWSDLWVDGRPKGRTPWSGEVDQGEHVVRLVPNGTGLAVERSVTIAGGGRVTFCWDHVRAAECAR